MQRGNKPQIDLALISLIILLAIFSLLAIYSGSQQYISDGDPFHFVKRQIVWYVIGFLVMGAVAKFDYELLKRPSYILYAAGIVLLLFVFLFGVSDNGSQRWINVGFTNVQPSEFMKLFLVLALANVLSKAGSERLGFKASIPVTLKAVGLAVLPFAFIIKQPDLGTALVIAVIAIVMVFMSSISLKILSAMFAGAVSLAGGFMYMYTQHLDILSKVLEPHQIGRIYGWLNPVESGLGYGYQLREALMGIGSGKLTGAGFDQGTQVQSGDVPEVHTDFIFTVVGEEFGFIGSSLLLCLFFLLVYRIILIAIKAQDLFGVYICVGVVGLLTFQIFQNIAMTIGLMPITGLALPFMSYGGSSLLTNMFALGLVLSVQLRSRQYMFSG